MPLKTRSFIYIMFFWMSIYTNLRIFLAWLNSYFDFNTFFLNMYIGRELMN